MTEYFELYRILEDGEVEHIDQIRVSNKDIFESLYNMFPALKEAINNVNVDHYYSIYELELKDYLMNNTLGFDNVMTYFINAHKDINVKEDESIQVRRMSSYEYRKYDGKYNNEYQFVDYIVNEKRKEDKNTIITEDILKNAGFKSQTTEWEQKYYKEELKIPDFCIYRLWTEDESPLKLDIHNGTTNNGSEWNLHIDNCDCCTIGSADIDTVYQFNLMMEVFNSKFRL